MAHAATTDRAAAARAALRRSPNFSAVSCALASAFAAESSPPSPVALSTSTSGIPVASAEPRARSLRVRAELPFQPPPAGISPTSSPSSWSSRESGTTSAFALGSAKTRCFTRSASAAVTPYVRVRPTPREPSPSPSPSSADPPPRRVMLVASPAAERRPPAPSRLAERFVGPSPPFGPDPSESANDDAAAPNASSGASARRPAVSNERVASPWVSQALPDGG